MANTTLDVVQLASILPPSIASDPQVVAVAGALDDQTQEIAGAVLSMLPWLVNLGTLPERIVDLLAWQYNVPFYDGALTLAQKRALVTGVISFWRICGTRAAVQNVCDIVFGAGNCTITEWFEAGGSGTPYTFYVDVADTVPYDMAGILRLLAAIGVTKNVRSWLYLRASRSSDLTDWIVFGQYQGWIRTSG